MSTAELSRVIVVTDDVERVLREFEVRARGVPKGVLAEGLITAVDDLIQAEGRPPHSWPELLPSTEARNPKRIGGKILQDSGLLAAFQESSGSPGPDWVQVESPAPYAGFHVTGTRHMERRDPTDIDLESVVEGMTAMVAAEVAP